MNTKIERLKNKLQESGISPTVIRIKILEYLDNNKKHPDVDTVYRDLKEELPVLSKTSVYNTLNLLAEKGLAAKLMVSEGLAGFDSNPDPHFHFICDRCGMVYDLEVMSSVFRKKEIEGHSIDRIQGYVKGLCRNCRGSKKQGLKVKV